MLGCQAAGVYVTFEHFSRAAHGFLDYDGPDRRQAIDAAAADLRRSFANSFELMEAHPLAVAACVSMLRDM